MAEYIPKDGGTDGSEKKGEGDGGGDIVSRPVELLFEGSDGEGDGEEVPRVDSPCEPAGEKHCTLEWGEHRGELEGVEGSAIAFDATLLLGRELEQAVRRVDHNADGEEGTERKMS